MRAIRDAWGRDEATTTRRASTVILCAFVAASAGAGCGEDEVPPPKPAGAKTAKPAATTQRAGAPQPGAVIAYRRVEDRVTSDAEKKAIRHKFRESDFAPDLTGTENRDPFRSFVVSQPGIGQPGGPPAEATDACPKKRQWARGFSARELKLVGIVARGTIRYALFSDPGQYGYVIHPGDCIGKEKARVKEIGASFVTLEISAETPPNQPPRPAEQRSIQLHPKDLPIGESTDDEATDERGAPVDLRQRSDELLRGDQRADQPSGGALPPPPPPPPPPTPTP
jgi:Tfp pilus assembly protein PilP